MGALLADRDVRDLEVAETLFCYVKLFIWLEAHVRAQEQEPSRNPISNRIHDKIGMRITTNTS